MTKNQRNLDSRGDDVLADAIGKIFLLRVIAHVGESEDGDRGPIERRQGRWARLEPLARRSGDWHRCVALGLAVHVADKPDAPACDGADQFLFRGAVADRLARRVDAAGKSRVRHDPAAPDRGEKIVLADDALAIFQQEGQDDRRPAARRQSACRHGATRAGRYQAYDWQRETALVPPGSDGLIERKSSTSTRKIEQGAKSFVPAPGISGCPLQKMGPTAGSNGKIAGMPTVTSTQTATLTSTGLHNCFRLDQGEKN